jgi:hypothetical protein
MYSEPRDASSAAFSSSVLVGTRFSCATTASRDLMSVDERTRDARSGSVAYSLVTEPLLDDDADDDDCSCTGTGCCMIARFGWSATSAASSISFCAASVSANTATMTPSRSSNATTALASHTRTASGCHAPRLPASHTESAPPRCAANTRPLATSRRSITADATSPIAVSEP